ncbi:muraminidase [Novosphingobium barchaimii LL02]|uniref:Lysozyme n=1 Tax=Novosphingobium barchaimii LL02 TaxID=1114963 RepID=A0A0J7Y672_9SPHN|nr:glycoside hydrolase family protein [Novosphingobium barchaimii]KMS59132.1 muraminidase [Novosphingobium barchaimii LL02]
MNPTKVGTSGIALMHKWEGCELAAYPDPGSKDGKPWTIGYGATGPGIAKGVVWTQAQADARFEQDLVKYAAMVSKFIGDTPTSQAQFDALVSFHYNTGAIASSTLGKLHKAGRFDDAAGQFGKWIYNDGKAMNGLKSRRADEAALYQSAAPIVVKQPVPVAAADVRVVNAGSGLNVRAKPSASATKLGGLSRGTAITVLEDTGDWVRFVYQGRDAWVNDQFLTIA